MSGELTLHVAPGGALMSDYEIASAALARAVTVDEVKRVNDAGERLKFEARKAGDRDMLANAVKLVMEARRRLGEMLIAGKESGQIVDGRPKKGDENRIRLADIGIDLKLSMESQKLARFDARDFEAMLQASRDKILAGKAVVINPVKDLGKKEKALRRAIRLAQLAAKQKDLPNAKFGVILADPEWPDEDVWSEAGLDRAPDNHYPTSSIADIAARPVGDIAADDSVLGLWIPMRHLARGTHVKVLDAWGFSARAILIWDKIEAGTGYWVRNRAEALVIAVRGNVPAPTPGTQWEDIVSELSTVHSRKPDWQYAWFEQFFPNLKKIELNARRRRPGWEAWGYEAPDEELPVAIQPDGPAEPAGLTEAHPVSPWQAPHSAALVDASPPEPNVPTSSGARAHTVEAEQPVREALDSSILQTGGQTLDAGEGLPGAAALPQIAAAEGPEDEPLLAGEAAPSSPAILSADEQNALIERAYRTVPFPGLEAISAATGLSRNTIKQRAKRRGWGDEAHRLAIVTQPARAPEREAAE